MATSHGSADNEFLGLKPQTLAKERERKNFKALLGVCRVKVFKRGVGFETVASGCIIKGLHEQALLENKCCLVTSDKLLTLENFSIADFYMDFRKLKTKEIKTIKLGNIADGKASIERPRPGMVAIILKEHNVFVDGKAWRSVVTSRPFSKELNDDGSRKFLCQVVDDTSDMYFDVKSFTLKRTNDQEFILCDGDMEYRSLPEFLGAFKRNPSGAVILTGGENPKAVGILNFSDDEKKKILPILLPGSQIRYLVAPLCPLSTDSVPQRPTVPDILPHSCIETGNTERDQRESATDNGPHLYGSSEVGTTESSRKFACGIAGIFCSLAVIAIIIFCLYIIPHRWVEFGKTEGRKQGEFIRAAINLTEPATVTETVTETVTYTVTKGKRSAYLSIIKRNKNLQVRFVYV